MTQAIENGAGLQVLISGDNDTFSNKAAFYDFAAATPSLGGQNCVHGIDARG
jgi:hypothetical protein